MTKRKDKKAPVKISALENEEVKLSANEEVESSTPDEIVVEEANANLNADEMVVQEIQEEAKETEVKTQTSSKKDKPVIDKKNNKKEDDKKKPKKEKKEKKGLKRRSKETVSELKKVTWPKFPEVVKKTGVVIAVVLIFAVVLLCLDLLFGFLSSALMGKPFIPFS